MLLVCTVSNLIRVCDVSAEDVLDIESSVESGYLAQREALYFPIVFLNNNNTTAATTTKATQNKKKTDEADDFLDAILGELDDLDDDEDDDDSENNVAAAKQEVKDVVSAAELSQEEVDEEVEEVAEEDEEIFEVEEATSMSGFAAVDQSTYLPTDHATSVHTSSSAAPPQRRYEEVEEVVDALLHELVRDAFVRAHDVFHRKEPLQPPSDQLRSNQVLRDVFEEKRDETKEEAKKVAEEKQEEKKEEVEDAVEEVEEEDEIGQEVEQMVAKEVEDVQNLAVQETSLYSPVNEYVESEEEDEDEEPVVIATSSSHPSSQSNGNQGLQNQSSSSVNTSHNTSALQKLRADATPFERAQIMVRAWFCAILIRGIIENCVIRHSSVVLNLCIVCVDGTCSYCS